MSLLTSGPELARAFMHQLSWSTLLGVQVFESFFVVKLVYRHLPYENFTKLQRNMFPVYFQLQTVLSLLTITTMPVSAFTSTAPQNVWLRLVPLSLTALCSSLNFLVYGPRSSRLMMEKLESMGPRPTSPEDMKTMPQVQAGSDAENMKKKKPVAKRFKSSHMMSIHLNAIALFCTTWGGLGLVFL